MCTRVEETERPDGAAARASLRGRRVTAFSHISGFASSILLHENNLVVIADDIPLYLDFWRQGRFPLDLLVGRRIALSDVNDAFATVGADAVERTVITSFE
ncbi:MAG TPA: hypothetical protein VNQ52_03225 [Microbacteriaceae bacterium]|nr:hypothetical protein [Microbacteriaceae bacterium]